MTYEPSEKTSERNDDVKPVPKKERSNGRVKRPMLRFDVQRDGARLAAILGAIILINVGAWFWMVRPRASQVSALEEQKSDADLIETRASRTLDDLREISRHAASVEESIRTFYDDMLATSDRRLVRFQRALNDVGTDFRVVPERVSIGTQPLKEEGIEVVGFNFPLTGGYENLRTFLDRLERLEQFLLVRAVNLRGGKEGGRALELVVEVETYFNNPELMKEDESRGRDRGRRSLRGRS